MQRTGQSYTFSVSTVSHNSRLVSPSGNTFLLLPQRQGLYAGPPLGRLPALQETEPQLQGDLHTRPGIVLAQKKDVVVAEPALDGAEAAAAVTPLGHADQFAVPGHDAQVTREAVDGAGQRHLVTLDAPLAVC